MSQSALNKHIVKVGLYHELQSKLFHLNHPDVLKLLDEAGSVPHTFARIKELCLRSRLLAEEGAELQGLLEKLVGTLTAMASQYDQYQNEVSALSRLGKAGAELIWSGSFHSKLKDKIFGSSYDNVCDKDFERRKLYWIDPNSQVEFEHAVSQLLRHGKLELVQLSSEPSHEKQFHSLQTILIGYGLTMLQTMPYAVFAELPSILKELTDECSKIKANSQLVQGLAKSDMLQALESAMMELRAMVIDETRKGSEFIHFDSLLFAKSGIKPLRDFIEKWSTNFPL